MKGSFSSSILFLCLLAKHRIAVALLPSSGARGLFTGSKINILRYSVPFRAHVFLHFDNRSFHQDHPQQFCFRYFNITLKRAQRGKMLQRIFLIWKWTFSLTSSPSSRSAEIFQDAETYKLPVAVALLAVLDIGSVGQFVPKKQCDSP